jgi:hypothetical protein
MRAFALTPTLDEQEAEYQQAADRLDRIGRAALRARQALANLDVDRSESALSRTLAGVKGELDEILDRVGPLPEEWRRVVAPEIPPGVLVAPDTQGDPSLFADPA